MSRNLIFRGSEIVPSVYQIRWMGCKGIELNPVVTISGVVAVDKSTSQLLQIRESMKKFDTDKLTMLYLCDYSRYRYILCIYNVGRIDMVT